MMLTKQYDTTIPIRIAPTMLMFPQPAALKQIYWNGEMNTKAEVTGTGVLGPEHLATTLDPERHRQLRKALGGPHWSIGALKKNWEGRIDEHILLLVEKLQEKEGEEVLISDKLAGFAADIMTILSFSKPWGFVQNDRDERGFLEAWRAGLDWFGFVGRWKWFRDNVLKNPCLGPYCLPSMTDKSGNGYLSFQADRMVREREELMAAEGDNFHMEQLDFLQYSLNATTPAPLTPPQRRAHATLLIQAGADTTGTALGSTLGFILPRPPVLAKCLAELTTASQSNFLSTPISYHESTNHLPYMQACIKESLRLQPPASNLFARVVPPGGREICGIWIPGGVEVTSVAYVVQRDPVLYGPDPEVFRPERWLECGEERRAEMEGAQFVFSIGARVCLGRDVALMELGKVIPELIRQFEMEVVRAGEYVVAGGVAYNRDSWVRVEKRRH